MNQLSERACAESAGRIIPTCWTKIGGWSIIWSIFVTVAAVTDIARAADAAAPSLSSGPDLVDWSPNSEWRKKLARDGRTISAPLVMAAPARGRDKLIVRAKEKERAAFRGKSKGAQAAERSMAGNDPVQAERINEPARAALDPSVTLGLGEQSTALIEDIAWGLGYDPLAIFNWVLTKVEYHPYFGLRQGAHVTALELQGNDYDQCVLLVSLLKQAGVPSSSINYVDINITYSAEEINEWLRWDFAMASSNLTTLGIANAPASGGLMVRRLVVDVLINGTTYRLDPAFKRTSRSIPLVVTDISPSYSAESITAQAGGTAPSDDEVREVAVDAFQGALSTAATAYVRNAAQNHHGRDARSILAIPVLAEPERTALPTTLVQPNTTVSTWSEIPEGKSSKLQLNINGVPRTYHWCDVADDLLTLRFDGAGRASLYRNDVIEATETGTPTGSFTMTGSRIYAEADTISVPFASTPMTRAGVSLILPTFANSRGRMKQTAGRQVELATADDASQSTLIHTLTLLGLQRAVHQENYLAVAGAMSGHLVFDSGSVWFFHARGPTWIGDGPDIKFTLLQKASSEAISFKKIWEAVMLWSSATEHLCMDQMSPTSAKSTVAVFESALRAGYSLFRLKSSNWSALFPRIDGGVLSTVQDHVTAGHEAFVPSKLQIPIFGGGTLTGQAAYLPVYTTAAPWSGWWRSGGYLIDAGFNGSENKNMAGAAVQAAQTANSARSDETADGTSQTKSVDPVDLNTGAFLYEAPGLTLGAGNDPVGLNYKHYYSSLQRLQNTAGISPGWTHSYDLFMASRHATDIDIRTASVAEVAPMVIAVRYLSDIITADPSAKQMAQRALTVNWAAKNYLNAKATIALGARRIEFQRIPDGSYIQSSSLPMTLVRLADGRHELTVRYGNKITFQGSAGRASAIVDPYGNTLTLDYSGGKLALVKDGYGRSLTFAYNGNDLMTVSDGADRSISYQRNTYSGYTDLRIIDPEASTTIFEASADRIIRVLDGRSRPIVRNHYDSFNRVWGQEPLDDTTKFTEIGYAPGLARETDATGARSWTSFDLRGRRIAYRDAVGGRQVWEYDGADRVTLHLSARDAITTFVYDANHVLRSVTRPSPSGPGTNTRTTTVDSQGRPQHVYNYEGKATSYTYNDFGQAFTMDVKSITSPGGIVTSFTYDAKGRVQTHHPASYASEQNITYAYDGYGNVDTVTYPGAAPNVDDYGYATTNDAIRGDLTQYIDRNEAKATFSYNKRRQKTSVSLWKGTTAYTSQIVYDAAGDIDYTVDASGRKTDLDHDALGHLLNVKRGAYGPSQVQFTTQASSYDARNKLWKSADALGNETEFLYDAAQRLQDVYDPLRRRTQALYDRDGNLTSVFTPLGLVPPGFGSTTVYNSSGWKDGTTDAQGQTVDYGYDKDGRMAELGNRLKYEGTSLSRVFTWNYDDDARKVTSRTPRQQPGRAAPTKSTVSTLNTRGLPDSVQEPSGQTTAFNSYDAEGRLLQKTDPVGTTTYTYWPNGLLESVTEGTRTTYRGYDKLNRLNEYRDGEGNTLLYDYYPSGELKEITYPAPGPGGTNKVTYTYDDLGRLWTVTDWFNRVTTYTYDNASRLTRIDRPTGVAGANSNGTYRIQEYDAASQLRFIKEYKRDGTLIFFSELRYDDDSRITSSFVHPKPAALALSTDNLLYDDDNRLSTWNTQSVTHDEDGNMIHGPLADGTMGSYGYDARNRLTTVAGSGYRYNPEGLRVEITGTGAATFVVDPNASLSRVLSRTKNGITTYYVYGLGLLYEETGGTIKTYHFNQVGSTLAMTNGSQDVTDRMGYAPFGRLTERTGSTDTPFLFNGEFGVITDGNCDATLGTVTGSGLVYMRNRYYNPRLMRFLNSDPLKFGGGLNWYAFAGDNPISLVDPLGLRDSRANSSPDDSAGEVTTLPAYSVGVSRWQRMQDAMDRLAIRVLPFAPGGQAFMTASGHFYAGNYGQGGAWLVTTVGEIGLTIATWGGYSAGQTATQQVAQAAENTTTVIGRVKDLQKLGPGEKSLLDRLPNLGNPKANWQQNSGVLRQEMNRGLPIRDASPGDMGGQFLNAERNLLRDRGWTFDAQTNLWMPPKG